MTDAAHLTAAQALVFMKIVLLEDLVAAQAEEKALAAIRAQAVPDIDPLLRNFHPREAQVSRKVWWRSQRNNDFTSTDTFTETFSITDSLRKSVNQDP